MISSHIISSHFLIYCSLILLGCKSQTGKFVRLDANHTNISFTNNITEDDTVNIFDFANIYNGGGVGVGDFNNDGLQDLYFTGNMVSNKLYLNKGKMKFEDVTAVSNTDGKGVWSRGIAVVDINNDGRLDMYVCATAKRSPLERINILYVNQGVNKDNIPMFKDMAAEYGLADTTQSTMAYFFDYDNDADLDLYIGVNHIIQDDYTNTFKKRNLNGEHPSTGKLYRNDWNNELKHAVYTDVSRQAGILIEGYTHAVNIFDINNDGWQDILVANDYISNNVLYINNKDGTFTDRVTEYFKHTAANSMGTDAVDINNDGLEDVIEVDMAPQDNRRKKMFQNANSYQTYQNSDLYGFQYQYTRNMVHVNQGLATGQLDSITHPVFSDVGYFCGIAETDWSWTPLVADFDNDGNKDIMFTNGFPKDITDHDFMIFRQEAFQLTSKKDMLAEIPEVKIPNYLYRNNGNLSFTDYSKNWGIVDPTFSNGAVYADLDNDGDLDIVINNIRDPALVYENRIQEDDNKPHYLSLDFVGTQMNRNGMGAFVAVHYDQGKKQVLRNMPYRGYLSSVEQGVHFGLGNTAVVDSVIINWPDGKMQLLRNVKADQVLTVKHSEANLQYSFEQPVYAVNALFRNISDSLTTGIIHKEDDFIDFNIQKLLPHKFSQYGPGLAVGDVDGNGIDDLITGGSFFHDTQILLQEANGQFRRKTLRGKTDTLSIKNTEDLGLLLFDADNDKDLDLYIASGGYELERNTPSYQDQFFVNDGKGNFKSDTSVLPKNFTSKFCVRASDYDKDGDLDLFVAGRVDPWFYPRPVSSFILRNDTKNNSIKFTDVSDQVAAGLKNIGLVCDAVFSDFDNDGWQDLILTGEWMPVTFLKNDKGLFRNVSTGSGIGEKTGWWNTIAPGDFDNDGDIDYIVGNLGTNSLYKASDEYPAYITAKDFDGNGSYDAIPSLFLPESFENPQRKEYPAHTRDDLVKQIIGMRSTFQNYKSYAAATMDQVLTPQQRKDALRLQANTFQSSFLKNEGQGRFSLTPLPLPAQVSVLCGIVVEDFDGDGNLDALISGNDYGTDVYIGRYDALNGLFLKGDGRGGFSTLSILQSGIYIPGDGKALVKFRNNNGKCLLASTENKGPLRIFELKKNIQLVLLQPFDMSAEIRYKDGRLRKQELYYGYSYLSQSGRFLNVDQNISSVEVTDYSGNKRKILPH